MNIDYKKLGVFLKHAHKNTYANKNALKVISTRLGSSDYHFQQGDLTYHDTYFGSKDFMGEEIIYKNEIPVWGMNYYGYLLRTDISERDIYDFLRQALMQDYTNIIPVRGPSRYVSGIYKYSTATDGGIDRFGGTETVFLGEVEVYRGWYHGGFLT